MRWVRILSGIIISVAAGTTIAGPRDSLWSQVDTAISKGLPQTAITLLDQIIPGALQDQANAEATKAICLKINLQGQIAGYDIAGMIVSLEAEIAQAPEAMKPVMEAVLADWYWRYFQQNRYRFLQRTTTAEPPGEDITTWDLARILAEIDKHFVLALSGEAELKTIPVGLWKDLLEPGTVPDSYRPTLYDFLAQEALTFYQSGEQAALPEETFEIMADSPIFAPVAEFLQWQPQTSNTDSAKLKAVRLYQNLLAFHQNDADKTAFIDVDLDRLVYGYNVALGPEKPALYEAALARFTAEWPTHEIVARAFYQWATVVYAQGDYIQARTLAKQGWDGFPASIGGAMCYNLIGQIEGHSLTIQTERVWNDPLPDIAVTYRNLTKVYFRAVPANFEDYLNSGASYWSWTQNQRDALLTATPVLTWSEALPATEDYQQRTVALPAPQGLAKGFYLIVASADPSFQKTDNQVNVAMVWVSNLAMVVRTLDTDGIVEGFVLDAKTGQSVAGATITRWKYAYNRSPWSYEFLDRTQCGDEGLFRFSSADWNGESFLIMAESNGDMLASEAGRNYSTHSAYSRGTRYQSVVFFTDRALYRPGQTIHFKGICISIDSISDSYQTVAGTSLTVVFKDVNGQEIARQDVRSNDYGSFSGSFTAPRDRLMGRMSINSATGPYGSTTFNVEEYKRPKFRVEFAPSTEAPRLNAEVVVPGKATAYTGASIGGAKVEWRVVRQVRYPIWR